MAFSSGISTRVVWSARTSRPSARSAGRERPRRPGSRSPACRPRCAGIDERAVGPRGGDVVSLGLERHPVGVGGLGRRHVDLEAASPFGPIGDDASLDAARRAKADLPPGGLRLPVDEVQLLRAEGADCDLYCTEAGAGHGRERGVAGRVGDRPDRRLHGSRRARIEIDRRQEVVRLDHGPGDRPAVGTEHHERGVGRRAQGQVDRSALPDEGRVALAELIRCPAAWAQTRPILWCGGVRLQAPGTGKT